MAKKAHPLQPREKQVIPGPSSVELTANPQPKRHKTRITTPIIGRTLARQPRQQRLKTTRKPS